jgi:hypothetical protein
VMGGNFYEPRQGSAFPIGGVGLSWYFLDYSSVNIDAIKEWGRVFGTTYVASLRYKDPQRGFRGTVGASLTNFGHRIARLLPSRCGGGNSMAYQR